MAFDLVHEDGVLLVAYAGVITVDERTRALTAAFASTPPTERRRVLVDFRNATATPPALDFETTKRFVDLLAKETKGGSARIAYLTDFELPIDRCIEMLIESRRLPVRRFTDKDAAMAWLREA